MLTRFECTTEDGPAVLEFLEHRPATSLFLLENLRTLGIVGGGVSYVAARSGGAIVGVASVNAAGFLLLQAPEDAAPLAALALRAAAAPFRGILGPTEQVSAVLDRLGLRSAPARVHSDERLYELDLRALLPTALSPDSCVRLATAGDVEALTPMRRAYLLEALGAPDDAGLLASAKAEAARMSRDGVTFVLVARDEVVSMTTFTARHGGAVQIGGVFTPSSLRGRKYGRAVVAGSLVHARNEWGARRAVLFTAESNTPAQRAYEALGFARTGGYTLHFFREPIGAWPSSPE